MDLSKLSTDDLKALQSGDLSKVSTEGLKYVQEQQVSSAPAVAETTPAETSKGEPTPRTDELIRQGKMFGSSIVRGLGSLPTLGYEGLAAAARKISGQPSLGGQTEFYGEGGPGYALNHLGPQPQNKTEEYVRAATEGLAPGGIAGKVRSAITGLVSSVSGKAGGDLMHDTGPVNEALSSVLASFLGGGATGLVSTMRTNSGDLAQRAMKGIKPDEAQQAGQTMGDMEKAGITPLLSQALNRDTNVKSAVETLAQSQHGEKVIDILRKQPGEVKSAMDRELAKLPGRITSEREVANASQESATKIMKDIRASAGDAYKQVIGNDNTKLDPAKIATFEAQLTQLAKQHAPDTATRIMIDDVKDRLKNQDAAVPPQPIMQMKWQGTHTQVPVQTGTTPGYTPYHTDPFKLADSVRDSLDTVGARKLNTNNLDANSQRVAQQIRNLSQQHFDNQGSLIGQANRAYSNVMDTAYNPTSKSIIGDVAGKTGALEDANAPLAKVYGMFTKGTDPKSDVSDIRTFADQLRKLNPNPPGSPFVSQGAETYVNSVKSFLSNKWSTVLKDHPTGTDENVGAALRSAFFGSEAQKKGLQDMIEGVALATGRQDSADMVRGFTKFMELATRTAERPKVVTNLSPYDMQNIARESKVASSLEASAVQPGRFGGRAIRGWLNKDSYEKMDSLLTDKDKIDALVKLGRTPALSPKNAVWLGIITGAAPPQADNQSKESQ